MVELIEIEIGAAEGLGVAEGSRGSGIVRNKINYTSPVHLFPPDMPCMKNNYKDKEASAHWSAARNEQRPWSR